MKSVKVSSPLSNLSNKIINNSNITNFMNHIQDFENSLVKFHTIVETSMKTKGSSSFSSKINVLNELFVGHNIDEYIDGLLLLLLLLFLLL